MARVIQISFDELSQELFDWVIKQNKKPLSWLGREAFECFYRIQSHAAAAGLSWQEWIEQADKCFAMVKEESSDGWQDWLERAIDHMNHYSD